MIELKNVFISFEKPVIQNFSMSVKQGEKIALSGHSGIGKSTILHLLLGFVEKQNGDVIINQMILNPSNIRKIRRHISWLPQELSMRFDFVEELFYYPFSFIQNKSNLPDKKAVSDLLYKLNLEDQILTKKVEEISGGQKQRVALASQLLLKKPILLLDEPSSALDEYSQKIVLDLICSLPNVTLVSATHNQNWLARMDRIVSLNEFNLLNNE